MWENKKMTFIDMGYGGGGILNERAFAINARQTAAYGHHKREHCGVAYLIDRKKDTAEDMSNMHDDQGIFVELGRGTTAYAVWYEPEQCYIAIRKLTPKECFRLQGWTDDYFEKARFVNSDSQLYKQAGNGVTVSVIEAIARRLEWNESQEQKQSVSNV